jgi:Bacterial-like globin
VLHRADLLHVLANAASAADLRTGQRVTVMVQHDWSGEFTNQRIAELGGRRPAVPDPPHRQWASSMRRACAGGPMTWTTPPGAPREPTVFEWAGGTEAFSRLTRIFYGHVKTDPILASVFAEMTPEHPEWVAQWLGEVFGGPPTRNSAAGIGTCFPGTWVGR